MAKKLETPQEENHNKIISQDISSEMRQSFLDYAMSVITDRALPDVRDGLKPVHRRILYTMNEMNLTSSAKFRKSAAVVGDVLGKYHPHGDMAVYESMVKLAQDFSTRYPLVMGQGNFGSIDGDSPAAHRYTEAKMSRLSSELLRDIEKETVDFIPNYDATRKEPVVLPTRVPNVLLNGGMGIAVGMATNIPPHNLREVIDATVFLIDNEKASTEDLLQFVKGPDFPTGGIAFNQKDIAHAYANGRGGVTCRGEAEIVEAKGGSFQIIITSIPYRVNKANLIENIAGLVRDKKVEGIKGLRDESTTLENLRIVIELKGTVNPQKVLNSLYKYTQLEENFNYNMVVLVDGVPQTLSLKPILSEFISHRKEVVVRRTEFELKKAEDREHILLGLKKALDHIDEIIKLIKASKDTPEAHANLMKKFKFSERQATAILEMKLQKLAGLERKKIENELKEIQKLIAELLSILKSPKKVLTIIKKELAEISEKYGDDRRTKIVKGGAKSISVEDLIPEEESTLVMTLGGYIKRTNPDEFKKQKRGGVGVVDLNTKDEDVVVRSLTTSTHSDLLFFSDKGKAYQVKMYDLPEGRRATKGKSIMNFLSLSVEEKITSVLAIEKGTDINNLSLLMVTKEGTAKRVEAASFAGVRKNGLIAITLHDNDELISVALLEDDNEIILATHLGQSIRFKASDIRVMGRGASGVRAIKLGKADFVVSSQIITSDMKDTQFLTISKNGYGKKTELAEYKVQSRGGSGIKTFKVTDKTGKVVDCKVVTSESEELVAMSEKSQVIRMDIKDIPSLGRQTQGVRLMKLRSGDSIASAVCL